MAKTSIRLTMFMIVSLTMLTIIASCITSTSSPPDAGKVKVLYGVFFSATDITEIPFFISQDARIYGRPDEAEITKIKNDSGLLGYCVESKVVSRSGPFRIRVLLDNRLYVKKATVISYPWDRGRDVCKHAFTSQFNGKGPQDPIQLGKDIDTITGATISCHVMAEGVRDTIKLLKLANKKQFEK